MDTREAIVQLPSYLAGDLSPKEAAILEGHLDVNPEAKAAKERMARQLTPLVNLPAPEVGEAALRQLFDRARDEIKKIEPDPVRDLWHLLTRPSVARWTMRAAAVLVAAAAVGGLAYAVLNPASSIVGREVDLAGRVRQVRDGEVVQAAHGRPVTLQLAGGTVQMDGSSALRVSRDKDGPVVDVRRGRVIVEAGAMTVRVRADGHEFGVVARSVGAFELDTAYENIEGRGALVEIQRQTISRVARIGERLYGVTLDVARLPDDVAERRVSMHGVALKRDDFISSFRNAAQRFGVVFKETPGGFDLSYQAGAPGSDLDRQSSILSVASVHGEVVYHAGSLARAHIKLKGEGDNFARIVGGEALPSRRDDMVQHMVVWAARSDLGAHFKANESVISLGGKVVTVPTPLPHGSVISADTVQVPDGKGGAPRIFKLGDADFPVPGGKLGKVVSLTGGGIELEVKGENGRYYVPLRR